MEHQCGFARGALLLPVPHAPQVRVDADGYPTVELNLVNEGEHNGNVNGITSVRHHHRMGVVPLDRLASAY